MRDLDFTQFSIVNPDPMLRTNLMAFGAECGPGWNEIVFDCLCELQAIEDVHQLGIQVLQIKEKFGTLRVYTSYSDDEIGDCITEAEERSSKTCELCGEPGKLYSVNGWDMTRCPNCILGTIN